VALNNPGDFFDRQGSVTDFDGAALIIKNLFVAVSSRMESAGTA